MSLVALTALLVAAQAFAAASPPTDPPVGGGVVVELSNGSRVEGTFRGRKDGAVWVAQDQGEIGIEPDIIVRMRPSASKNSEFEKRLAKVDRKNAKELWELAAWAKKSGLQNSADDLAREVIALDSNHEEARLHLGYERHGLGWQTFEEGMSQRGMVYEDGGWITKEEARQRAHQRERERMRRLHDEQRAAMSAARRKRLKSAPSDDLMHLIQTPRGSRYRYIPGGSSASGASPPMIPDSYYHRRRD